MEVLQVSPDGKVVLKLRALSHKLRCRKEACKARVKAGRAARAAERAELPSDEVATPSVDGAEAAGARAVVVKRRRSADGVSSGCAIALDAAQGLPRPPSTAPVLSLLRLKDASRCLFLERPLISVYIMHLDRRLDRKANVAFIRENFSGHQLVLFDAVDGERERLNATSLGGYRAFAGWQMSSEAFAALTFDDTEGRAGCEPFWTRELSAGELACALSHMGLWDHAMSMPEAYAVVIFEDGASTTRASRLALERLLLEIRNKGIVWDIFWLGRSNADVRGSIAECEEGAYKVCSFEYTFTPPHGRRRGKPETREACVIKDVGSWTGAYALSRRALELLTTCGFGDDLLNVEDFLHCCSKDSRHPRADLYAAPPVAFVRGKGGLVALTVTIDGDE